jgi:hypothetical protein
MAADMSLFDELAKQSHARHGRVVAKASGTDDDATVVAQVSLPRAQKERLTKLARARGLSFSAFVRLACEDYVASHNWESQGPR